MVTKQIDQNYRWLIRWWGGLGIILASLLLWLAYPPPDVRADTPITGDTTWSLAGSPYVVTETVRVLSGITLTIDPGVEVRLGDGASIKVDGTLMATGCTFTSNNPTPAQEDWGQIFFSVSSLDAVFDVGDNYVSGSLIQGCQIEWGGAGAGVNGAVETSGASPFIDGNTIQNNGASGIYAVGRSAGQPVVISGNSISANAANGDGGGIYVSNGQVRTNTVTGNSATNGGGIYAVACTVADNTVNNNSASNNGGGVYADGSTLTGNGVNSNTANDRNGGGIYATGSTLTNNTISSNVSSRGGFWGNDAYGGGVYVEGGTVTYNTISGNAVYNYGSSSGSIRSAGGGGVYASGSTVSDNTITNNEAIAYQSDDAGRGGGIYTEGGTVTNNTVSDNVATGGLDGYGGGIYADGGKVTGNTLDDNSATGSSNSYGGGIYARLNTVKQNSLTNNSANLGGAIYIDQGAATDNIINNNSAADEGGGIYASDTTVSDNTFSGNSAVKGGGLYSNNGSNLTDNTIENNTASLGGGLYAAGQDTVRDNTVQNNTAQNDGGGIYAAGGSLTENTIVHNTLSGVGHGAGAYISGTVNFSSNGVMTNTASGGVAGGISINGLPQQVQFNNFYGNQPYEAELISAAPVSATHNYWGPIDCADIAGRVYDGDDEPGRGQLLYAPSLYTPTPLAQLAAPSNLAIVAGTTSMTLTWTPVAATFHIGCRDPEVSGPDFGYRLHYNNIASCQLDGGQGLNQGDSPFDVGQNTTITVSGLPNTDYHFAITTYDYLGRQSPFSVRVTGTLPIQNYIQVAHQDAQPAIGADVYHNGAFLDKTDQLGLVFLNGPLSLGDSLSVLQPVAEQSTARAAHQGWSYRTYLTNIDLGSSGSPRVFTITQQGPQFLTVRPDRPLILFNLVVSIEWDARPAYLATIEESFRQASAYLYDVTDGQMAFGQVAIYDNAGHWSDADFQFSTKNTVRPYAFLGGITSSDEAHTIRVGRFWDGGSGSNGDWDRSPGYRTLIHEFGHYALYLHDEYFLRQVDNSGNFIGLADAYCTAPNVADPTKTLSTTNASLMFYQYNASELSDKSHNWAANCQFTEQYRRNHGESNWETVLRHYDGSDWTMNTPTSRGSVMTGPDTFPMQLLPFPEITIHNTGSSQSVPRQVTITLSPGVQPAHEALVALYTTPQTDTIAIDQGLTDRQGKITVYGASPGDTILAATFDGAYTGGAAVGEDAAYEISLGQASGASLSGQATGLAPYLSVIPKSGGTGLALKVAGLAQGTPLNAFVIPATGGGSPKSTPLLYSSTEEAYVGAVNLSGVGLGSGRIQISGGKLPGPINSNYNLHHLQQATATQSLYSEDGNFELHIPPGGAPAGEYATVLPTGYLPGTPPAGKQAIGSAYAVRLSGAVTALDKEGLLRLHYHPEVMGNYTDQAIYYWDAANNSWQEQGGQPAQIDNALAVTATRLGIYALLGQAVDGGGSGSVYLPLIVKSN